MQRGCSASPTILEYWIPADELAELNVNIGKIKLVAEFSGEPARCETLWIGGRRRIV